MPQLTCIRSLYGCSHLCNALSSGLGFGRKSDKLVSPMYLAATVPRTAAPNSPSIDPYNIDLTPADAE